MAMTIRNVIEQTDWKLLAEQKYALIHAIVCLKRSGIFPAGLNGLLNWINTLQDAAEYEGYSVAWLDEDWALPEDLNGNLVEQRANR